MKIVVTGGAGYIGTVLVIDLIQLPQVKEVVVYDNLSKGNVNFFIGRKYKGPANEKIKFVEGDILDSRKLKQALEGADLVFHLAARVTTPFANIDTHFYEQSNHWGTAELCYAVEECQVPKIIYASSASVYGSADEPFNEQSQTQPSTFYGISKIRGEDHVKRIMKGRETLVLRLANVFGYSKSMRFDAVINKFMFDAHFKNRINIHGNGKQSRPFIHINRLSQTLVQIAFKSIPNGIYNVVDKNLTILDIVDVVKAVYPSLEFTFIDQHMGLKGLRVESPTLLDPYLDIPETSSLLEEIQEFKEQFAF